jgi:hypothetical protein
MARLYLPFLLLAHLFATLAVAQSTTSSTTSPSTPAASPSIVRSVPGTKYQYLGCYNETTSVAGAGGVRALDGGKNEVLEGQMTVPMCLAYCGTGATQYAYAGLQFSRECWCAQHLSGASAKLDDAACDTACDGNGTTICGGSLKLSVSFSTTPSIRRVCGKRLIGTTHRCIRSVRALRCG